VVYFETRSVVRFVLEEGGGGGGGGEFFLKFSAFIYQQFIACHTTFSLCKKE
jgi:hypothetical protein